MIEKLPYEQIIDENFKVIAVGTPHLSDVAKKVDEIIDYLNDAAAQPDDEPTQTPTLDQYCRAYDEWYLKSTKDPVTYKQYLHIMNSMPHEVMNIIKRLDEGEDEHAQTT